MTDQISKAIDIVLAQSNDLWPIATGLILVALGMLASPVKAPERKIQYWTVGFLLAILLISIFSLVFGYLVKGSLIISLAELKEPNINGAAWWSFLQMLATVISLILIGILFLFNRKLFYESVSKLFGN